MADTEDEGLLEIGRAGPRKPSRCVHSRPDWCLQLQSCGQPLPPGRPQEAPQLLLQARQAPQVVLHCCGVWCGACWCWLLAAGAALSSGLLCLLSWAACHGRQLKP